MIVYLIHNTINGKYYVGWTSTNFRLRWYWHCQYARSGGAGHFSCAIRLHKPEFFKHEILATVATEQEARHLENLWIITLGSYIPEIGYNMTYGGEGSLPTEETKKLISFKKRGCISSNRGRIWITDGTKNRTIYSNSTIPLEWYQGRVGRSKKSKEKTSISLQKLIWITDKNTSRRIKKDEAIPLGWIKGRVKYKFKKKRKPSSEETKRSIGIGIRKNWELKRQKFLEVA